MVKDTQFDFNINWYELWMKQSREFFETADKNLKDIFAKGGFVDPQEHLKQINQWLETLKNQWESAQFTDEQKAYQVYWNMMTKMSKDATDLMLKQWIKRTHENNPLNTIRELYELWLNCCHETYQKYLQTKMYQETYAEFMNAALKFWKSTIPNE